MASFNPHYSFKVLQTPGDTNQGPPLRSKRRQMDKSVSGNGADIER